MRSEKSVRSPRLRSRSVARRTLSSLRRTAFCFHPGVLRFPARGAFLESTRPGAWLVQDY